MGKRLFPSWPVGGDIGRMFCDGALASPPSPRSVTHRRLPRRHLTLQNELVGPPASPGGAASHKIKAVVSTTDPVQMSSGSSFMGGRGGDLSPGGVPERGGAAAAVGADGGLCFEEVLRAVGVFQEVVFSGMSAGRSWELLCLRTGGG